MNNKRLLVFFLTCYFTSLLFGNYIKLLMAKEKEITHGKSVCVREREKNVKSPIYWWRDDVCEF